MNDIFSFNIISLIDILGVLQGVISGVVLFLINSKNKKPTIFLGLFVFLFSLEPINNILHDLKIVDLYPQLELLPVNFHFLAYPLFYFYIQEISFFQNKKFDYLILLPGLIELFLGILMFFLPITTKLIIKNSSFSTIYFILGFTYSILISVLIIKKIDAHEKEVKNQFSDITSKDLKWARTFIFLSITFQLFLLINYFVDNELWYFSTSVLNIVLIYWISFKGIFQEVIKSLFLNSLQFDNNDIKAKVFEDNEYEKSKTEFIDSEEIKRIIKNLQEYIVSSECYTKDNLTIIEVAQSLNIHPKRISYSLNKSQNTNFNSYINKFRIEKAKELLRDKSKLNLTIEGIGFEAGFGSKATFYAAFKKLENKSPSYFR